MNKKLQKCEVEEIEKQIRALLVSAPNGQTLLELDKAFKDFMCRPIPFKQMGYENATEFFQKNPNIGRLREIKGATFVYAVASEKDRHIAKLVAGQKKKASNFSKRAEKGVRFEKKVFYNNNDDYSHRKLYRNNSEYHLSRTQRFDTRVITRFNYSSRDNKENMNRGTTAKFYKQKSVPNLRTNQDVTYVPHKSYQDNHPVCHYKNIENPLKTIKTAFNLIDVKSLPESLFAKVVHTRCPTDFYIHIFGKNNLDEFEILQEEMESFYDDEIINTRYRLTTADVYMGKPCAVLFLKKLWRRGVILRFQSTLRIYLVDFGQIREINLSDVRHLSDKFLKLPAQAVPARLAHIQPLHQIWSQGAVAFFLKNIDSKKLKLQVKKLENDYCLSCILKDDTEKSINQILLDRRLARFDESDNLRESDFMRKVFLGEFIEENERKFNDQIRQLEEIDEIMQFTYCLFVIKVKILDKIITVVITDFFNDELEEYIMERDCLFLIKESSGNLLNKTVKFTLKSHQQSHRKVIHYLKRIYNIDIGELNLDLYPLKYLSTVSSDNRKLDKLNELFRNEKSNFSYEVANCKRQCIEQMKSLVNCGQTGLLEECKENLKTCVQLLRENGENILEIEYEVKEPPGLRKCERQLEKLKLASIDTQKMFEVQNHSKHIGYHRIFDC
ncbi:unnamed protein product [Dimorphilus gyrociliatus]|uniref:HTH OST-type domain-containing protein n=1 Tax=Dimorphilus gyrociliatus TaxID=2664684 RepID=A0A7I8VM39_9ANNE|nr:unnamed protein product [Dimorphilus gyrociliatus]